MTAKREVILAGSRFTCRYHTWCIFISLYNVGATGHRLCVCSCVLKRCGLTGPVVVIERAFTEGRGRWWWWGQEVRGQKDDAPVGRGRAWSVSARLASSTSHTHRPLERGVRGTHIYHWGTAVGLPGTGHSSPLHALAHPHTRTQYENTISALCNHAAFVCYVDHQHVTWTNPLFLNCIPITPWCLAWIMGATSRCLPWFWEVQGNERRGNT